MEPCIDLTSPRVFLSMVSTCGNSAKSREFLAQTIVVKKGDDERSEGRYPGPNLGSRLSSLGRDPEPTLYKHRFYHSFFYDLVSRNMDQGQCIPSKRMIQIVSISNVDMTKQFPTNLYVQQTLMEASRLRCNSSHATSYARKARGGVACTGVTQVGSRSFGIAAGNCTFARSW